MKKIIFAVFLSLTVTAIYSQTDYSLDSIKPSAKNIQNLKIGSDSIRDKIEAMIVSRQFILEINAIIDQSRNFLITPRIDVSSASNYIALNLNKIVLQLETNTEQTSNWPFYSFPSPGTISDYEINNMKKQNQGYVLRFHTQGKIGDYSITINISESGKTMLKMLSNNGISLNFQGIMVPLKQSRISPAFI